MTSTAICRCGLPIVKVPSHSSYDCEIEGEMWMHDAEEVPDGVDPCAAYDADDDHEGQPRESEPTLACRTLRVASSSSEGVELPTATLDDGCDGQPSGVGPE